METEPPQLQYAPPQPASDLRRKLRRWALPLLAVALAAFAVVRYGPAVSRNLEVLRRQRDAVAYAVPADHVTLKAKFYADPQPGGARDPEHAAAYLDPIPWLDFMSAIRSGIGPAHFIGELRGKDGRRRIVLVCGYAFHRQGWMLNRPVTDLGNAELTLATSVMRPGTLTSQPKEVHSARAALVVSAPASAPLRVYAGRPDPADPSHFTIAYQHGEARGTIDGWLRDDDSIELSVRDGPATGSKP